MKICYTLTMYHFNKKGVSVSLCNIKSITPNITPTKQIAHKEQNSLTHYKIEYSKESIIEKTYNFYLHQTVLMPFVFPTLTISKDKQNKEKHFLFITPFRCSYIIFWDFLCPMWLYHTKHKKSIGQFVSQQMRFTDKEHTLSVFLCGIIKSLFLLYHTTTQKMWLGAKPKHILP